MTMSQPFKDVWLPHDVELLLKASFAIGTLDLLSSGLRGLQGIEYGRPHHQAGRIEKALVVDVCPVVAGHAAGRAQQAPPARTEVITEVRVHGNQIVADDEVLNRRRRRRRAIAMRCWPRSQAAQGFGQIRVDRRAQAVCVHRSLPDHRRHHRQRGRSSCHAGRSEWRHPGPEAIVCHSLIFVPVLEGHDGYGLTYGARFAYQKPIGPNRWLSFPMTWGGTKKIGVELDRTFSHGPISRMEFGTVLQRRQNPAYEEQDDRVRGWGRVQRVMGPVRAGATAGWQRVVRPDQRLVQPARRGHRSTRENRSCRGMRCW
jgi:hypothetical protein